MHGDSGKPEAKRKRKIVPDEKRRTIGDCEPGDRCRTRDGRVCVVTAWFNGGPGGRWIDAEGQEGELTGLDASLAIDRESGLQ